MLRVAVAAALILLLSGCMAAAPPPADLATFVDDDGMTVTATRVEPVVHVVDISGRIASHLCEQGDDECAGGTLDWDKPVRDFADPAALFWRVSLQVDWDSQSLVNALRMTVYATKPCGIACIHARQVAQLEDPGSLTLDAFDIFLNEGETGVRVQLETVGYTETSWGATAVDYHLYGGVAGFRPAGEPVVVG